MRNELALDVMDRVANDGFAVCRSISAGDYLGLVSSLGTPGFETLVNLRPGIGTYLTQPDEVPLHTDHPDADLIAWRCEQQDEADGAMLLVDGVRAARECSSDERVILTRTLLTARAAKGSPAKLIPVLRETLGALRIFFAPWLGPTEPHGTAAYKTLSKRISYAAAERPVEVRLTAGDVLVVDNGRMLHGRRAILRNSLRRLRRFWIRKNNQSLD